MKNFLTFLTVMFFSWNIEAKDRIRRVEVKVDQITRVNTSLGIATIVQVPDRPSRVVLGNQDLFKVEYLDQAITIKPLARSSKSNLYIYTDYRRFNVELISGDQAQADYVVYLENEKQKIVTTKKKEKDYVKWKAVKRVFRNDSITLETKRLGFDPYGVLLLHFVMTSQKEVEFKPDWIWVTQNGVLIPIHNLFLSNLKLSKGKSINGILQIKISELNPDLPIRLEMRRGKISYLTIQKITSWK